MAGRNASYLTHRGFKMFLHLSKSRFGTEVGPTPCGICNSLQDVGDDRKPKEERLQHWEEVARAHPEFFRVSGKSVSISLVSRFVAGKERPPLKPELFNP